VRHGLNVGCAYNLEMESMKTITTMQQRLRQPLQLAVWGLCACVLVLGSHVATAQDVTKAGTVAATFLKIGAGPRATAMGEAFVATANDLTAAYWNPAGLAWLAGGQVTLSHTDWIADFQHQFGAAALNLGDAGSVAVSLIMFRAPDQEVTTVESPNGTGEYFSYQDVVVGISYSRKLTDRFSFGATVKYVSETIYRINASAVAFDLGTIYTIPGTTLRIGMTLLNFGTKMQFTGDNLERSIDVDPATTGETDRATAFLKTEQWDIPLGFKVALAYDFTFGNASRLTLAADAVNPNDNRENLNVGGELAYEEFLFFRAGFRGINSDQREGGLSYGGGVELPLAGGMRASVDYAFSDLGRLKSIHRFGVSLKF